ncbi:hypothetical protein DB88DRAFT_448313 [Papiliotrema laurentii]|uniref:Urease accessory protein UreF n=1 Tax=Papiliotrema laurentii TaxID=5418 RepID=A0AAD9FVS6_PAPLA|nr:hypothetical protein DB88DRAFT_448313 [Papiliotrema laurentii]
MSPMAIPSPAEVHLLYVLLDSNLPTGGFVASSGLESYAKHGFFTSQPTYANSLSSNGASGQKPAKLPPTQAMMEFAYAEVENYASTTLSFVADAWHAVNSVLEGHALVGPTADSAPLDLDATIKVIEELDQFHEATMLSHVVRRSSKAQGVAMLTLHSRGLSLPSGLQEGDLLGMYDQKEMDRQREGDRIVERYKRSVRGGKSPGHLAVCWGVITASLGLALERALHLHLFLHARSLLSSAVRLNIIGPYASSQLLLHPMRTLIESTTSRYAASPGRTSLDDADNESIGFWDWAETDYGPATTWPLGEVLSGRHDLQHSRIFNS